MQTVYVIGEEVISKDQVLQMAVKDCNLLKNIQKIEIPDNFQLVHENANRKYDFSTYGNVPKWVKEKINDVKKENSSIADKHRKLMDEYNIIMSYSNCYKLMKD